MDIDGFVIAQGYGAFDAVFQFVDVAWPSVLQGGGDSRAFPQLV